VSQPASPSQAMGPAPPHPPHPRWRPPRPGRTHEILRLCVLLKPAKEALRPTAPTAPMAPASPGDRNRNLTDMAVTCKERKGESAWPSCLLSARPQGSPREWAAGLITTHRTAEKGSGRSGALMGQVVGAGFEARFFLPEPCLLRQGSELGFSSSHLPHVPPPVQTLTKHLL
jgi:hypothetical protein